MVMLYSLIYLVWELVLEIKCDGQCSRILLQEFHISRFCLCHRNWKAFAFTPWLPQNGSFQWIFVLYRLILALYFLIYFIWAIVIGKGYFFVFATTFSFLLFTFYLLWSSVYVTARYFQQFAPCCEQFCEKQQKEETCDQIPSGSCDVKTDSTKWYEKIQWFLFTVGVESTLSITLIYWPFGDIQRDDNFEFYGHVNIALHLVNGVAAFIDIWVSQISVHLYHVIYLVGVTSLYAVFTGLYYVGGGGNDYDNGTYIYPQIDYGNSPGTASVFVIGVTIIYMPLVHLFVYINYLMREGLLYVIKKMCCKLHKNDIKESNGNNSAREHHV